MSHISEIKVKVRDLESLAEAAEARGGVFVEGQTTHRWYGRFVNDSESGRRFAQERGADQMGKCDHAIRLKDGSGADYEVGVVKSVDGDGFSLVFDSWGPGRKLEQAFGKDLSGLNQEYAATVTLKKAKTSLRGWTAKRETLPTGAIRLRLRKR